MLIAETQTINLADYIIPIVLPLILIVFFAVLVRNFKRSIKRSAEHMAYMREHSVRVEEKLSKIIEVLERRDMGV